jgi:hypothetical protein
MRNRENKNSKEKSHHYHWVIEPAPGGGAEARSQAQLQSDGALLGVTTRWQGAACVCLAAVFSASGVEDPAV